VDIAAYFRRIGYHGPTRPDLETLRSVQRAHALAIPYEVFDIFWKRPITTDPADAYEKIVGQGRGGACYEHNGLLGLALQTLGFQVARLAGDGDRPASHLVLRVDLDGQAFACDPGFSDAPLDPYPLIEGPFVQNGFTYRVELIGEDRFRFHNHRLGLAPGYLARPADEAAMAQTCRWLQTAPESPFVRFPISCIHDGDGVVWVLAGRLLRTIRPDGVDKHLVESQDEYLRLLRETFRLDLPRAAELWPQICRQHDEYERRKAAGGP
jgi:N-hydroxyarylamine O-acetyltransferase